jgi:hypothetical protein
MQLLFLFQAALLQIQILCLFPILLLKEVLQEE